MTKNTSNPKQTQRMPWRAATIAPSCSSSSPSPPLAPSRPTPAPARTTSGRGDVWGAATGPVLQWATRPTSTNAREASTSTRCLVPLSVVSRRGADPSSPFDWQMSFLANQRLRSFEIHLVRQADGCPSTIVINANKVRNNDQPTWICAVFDTSKLSITHTFWHK